MTTQFKATRVFLFNYVNYEQHPHTTIDLTKNGITVVNNGLVCGIRSALYALIRDFQLYGGKKMAMQQHNHFDYTRQSTATLDFEFYGEPWSATATHRTNGTNTFRCRNTTTRNTSFSRVFQKEVNQDIKFSKALPLVACYSSGVKPYINTDIDQYGYGYYSKLFAYHQCLDAYKHSPFSRGLLTSSNVIWKTRLNYLTRAK